MADKAEEKKVAKLTFDVDLTQIDTINTKLRETQDLASKINQNMKIRIDVDGSSISNMSADVEKALKKIKLAETDTLTYTASQTKSIGATLTKQIVKRETDNQKTSNAIKRQDNSLKTHLQKNESDFTFFKKKEQEKRITQQMKANQQMLNNEKTLADKISDYAKTYLIYQGFNQLKQAVSETIDEMVDLEYQMVSIDRVLNESTLNIDKYRDDLLQLAYDYGNEMDNVTDVALRLAQAGFDSNETLQLTEKTLLALNTAELDATQATDDMVAVMAQWGLMTGDAAQEAYDYGAIIDKINKVADNFPTTSADILDALKKVSSGFNLAGASIDETIAMITAAEKASQRGGKAIGTALGNITQQLKEDKKLDIAESLGLNFFTDESKTTFKDITEIFAEMSEKMQELKDAGKENSTEMQELLSIFTVFRRNIGASLLGEMSGEESTYAKALETSLNSLGYSIDENAKHLNTAKSAQAQFNAKLLELKTDVWDKGLEDTYRNMLNLGTDFVNGLSEIIDKVGLLPTAIGTATAALTLFNKQLSVKATWNLGEGFKLGTGFTNEIEGARKAIKELGKVTKDSSVVNVNYSESFKGYLDYVGDGEKTIQGFTSYLIKQKAATAAATVTTIALRVAMSALVSIAVTGAITLIDNLIHAEEKAIEKNKELIESNNDVINSYEEEIDTLDLYLNKISEMEEESGGELTLGTSSENLTELMNLQTSINSVIKDQDKQVKLVTSHLDEQGNVVYEIVDGYKEQLKRIKEINQEKRKEALKTQSENVEAARGTVEKYDFSSLNKYSYTPFVFGTTKESYGKGSSGGSSDENKLRNILKIEDEEEQVKMLQKFRDELEQTGKSGTDMYKAISEELEKYNAEQNVANEEINEYLEKADDFAYHELFDDKDIKDAEDFQEALNEISKLSFDDLKEMGIDIENFNDLQKLKDMIVALIREDFPEFAEEVDKSNTVLGNVSTTIGDVADKAEKLQNEYTALTTAQNELNKTGSLTTSTFNSLVDNDLLDYLEVVNGKLTINEQKFINDANAAKEDAKAKLQVKAANEILDIVTKDLNGTLTTSEKKEEDVTEESVNAANGTLNMARGFLAGTVGVEKFVKALGGLGLNWGKDIAGVSDEAKKQIQNVLSTLDVQVAAINKIKLTAAKVSSSSSTKSKSDKEKKEEEKYKKKLEAFKESLEDMAEEEEAWVKKQRQLETLSDQDMLYVTKQRIKKYQQYLKTIKKATWLNKEDRKELMEEYTKEIEELELEYFEYLKDILDDEIDAIEEARDKRIEAIEEEYDARIEAIEEAADAEIKALQKVEDERDRTREKEDYESERQEILDEIAYWEQRTGREAVESLAEAKKNLEELDKEWQRTQEDWDTEDLIESIEEQRDAKIEQLEEIEKKEIENIEKQTEAQIKALEEQYNYKVKMFSESDKIIYDNSKISAKNLYDTYKDDFVDPLKKELASINGSSSSSSKKKSSSSSSKDYTNYTVKKGDTLSALAKKYNTTIKKIMTANSSIKDANKIYVGQKLKIPKYHEGGIVGGNKEAFALLKPQEVILKPEWAASLNRMMKYFDNLTENNQATTLGGPNIEVNGDLIKIEATVRNQRDIDNIEKKVEKVLKDKFNIKK